MRTLLLFFSLLCFSVTGLAQNPEGGWVITTPTPDGEQVTWKFILKSDGTYAVDINVDGSIEVTGKYSVDGDTMTVQNDEGCGCCTEKGIYKFGLENDQLWMDPVEDSCPNRKPPQKAFFSKG